MISYKNLPDIMTKDEKQELYKNWTNDSWKILAERNLRLALKVANSFKNTGIEDEDLYSIASFALARAAKSFDPSKGNEFSSYAIPAMRNEILSSIRKNKYNPYPHTSLNDLVENPSGDYVEFHEMIKSGFDLESTVIANGTFVRIYQTASNRDKTIMKMFINGLTQKEIGRAVGLSQTNVSRIIRLVQKNIEKELEG